MLGKNVKEGGNTKDKKSAIMYRVALQRRFLYIKRIFKIKHMES